MQASAWRLGAKVPGSNPGAPTAERLPLVGVFFYRSGFLHGEGDTNPGAQTEMPVTSLTYEINFRR